MKYCFILLTLVLGTQSWWQNECDSWSCQTSSKLCYKPTCGLLNYCLNGDLFLFHLQDYAPNVDLNIDDYKKQLAGLHGEIDDNNSIFFNKELNDDSSPRDKFKKRREERLKRYKSMKKNIKQMYKKKQANLNKKVKGWRTRSAKRRAERKRKWKALKKKAAKKREKMLNNVVHNEELDELKTWSDVDPSNLIYLLEKNRDDEFRSTFLKPTDCGTSCKGSYKTYFSIWKNLITKLHKTYKAKYLEQNCADKRINLRTSFERLCSPYPEVVSLPLINYYEHMVDNYICNGW